MHNKTTLLVVSLFVLLVVAPAGAVAQEEPATNTTATPTASPTSTATPTATQSPTPTATATPSDSDDNSTYLIQVDPDVRIVSSTWDSGTVSFVIEADRSGTLTVTDASIPLQDHNAIDIPRKIQDFPEGRTRITFSVTEPSSAAVTVATSRGMVGLSPGEPSLFSGSASWSDVQLAAVSGAAGVGTVAIIVVIRTVLGRTDSPERVA